MLYPISWASLFQLIIAWESGWVYLSDKVLLADGIRFLLIILYYVYWPDNMTMLSSHVMVFGFRLFFNQLSAMGLAVLDAEWISTAVVPASSVSQFIVGG